MYFFLWKAGKITEAQLDSYCQEGSKFIGLAEPVIPEISFAGGSMGMGLPAAVGFAMAKKLKGEEGKVYCLMSDGELQIGTTWEALMIAAQHKLDNLVIIVDFNGFQAMGMTEDILSLRDIKMKFASFGIWEMKVDGHNFSDIEKAFEISETGSRAIIAITTKGKGVSFMEGNNLYHYKAPSEEEYLKAKEELL